MLPVYLKAPLFFNGKKAFFSRLIISVLLGFMLTGIPLYFFPAKAAARSAAQGIYPAYQQQLGKYSTSVRQHQDEQEKLKRKKALQAAVRQHIVQPGETLTRIARDYRVDLESLICWNGLFDPHLIFPGDVLDLLSIEGTMHIVARGDTLESVAECYQSKPQTIAAFNLLPEQPVLTPGTKLVIPGGILPAEERQAVQATLLASRYGHRGPLPPSPAFDWPVRGRISSKYGWRKGAFHYGLDIAVPYGGTIRAAAAGVVADAGIKQGYGLTLVISHSGGWRTLYAHCSRLLAEKNEKVSQGQPVALIGATGNATGPHLHLEIGHGEHRFDPLLFLPGS